MKMIRKCVNFSLGERSVYVKKTFLANSQRIADFGNQKSLAGYVVQKPNNFYFCISVRKTEIQKNELIKNNIKINK